MATQGSGGVKYPMNPYFADIAAAKAHGKARASSPTGRKSIDFDKLTDVVDDL